jgi:hypothetical protein
MRARSDRVLSIMWMACLGAGIGAVALGVARTPTPTDPIFENADRMLVDGRETFRYDTFGDEAFWGDTLRLHEAVATLSPNDALALGLKVDADAIPRKLLRELMQGGVNMDDPGITLALLKSDAVVGVRGFFERNRLASVGITCALCHSDVDDTIAPGVGSRLDGWANRDLDVGAIVAAAPDLSAFAELLQVPEDLVREVLLSWGPGKFDAQLALDGQAFQPDGDSAATLIPPAFGMAGVNEHTSTAGWGTVTYWNAFVANIEMHGQGTFFDPRLGDRAKYPVAARAGFDDIRAPIDLITPKLGALQFYQLAIPAPTPPPDSFDHAAARRGAIVFTEASCDTCHVPPLFTEPGYNTHAPEEIGIDAFQAGRSPDTRYRTAPLRGLWSHQKGGFYHDGRFGTLADLIDHYDRTFDLDLSRQERNDLAEYLKSL